MRKKETIKQDKSIKSNELLTNINQIVKNVGSLIKSWQDGKEHIIKRQQWMNFIIMLIICIGVILLAQLKTINNSAATGLLGAVIGYVFGHVYQKDK